MGNFGFYNGNCNDPFAFICEELGKIFNLLLLLVLLLKITLDFFLMYTTQIKLITLLPQNATADIFLAEVSVCHAQQ